MQARALLPAVVATGMGPQARAQPPQSVLPADIQLRSGVERADAKALVATLSAAQQGVRDGTAFFHLLAGAPASYAANGVSPRDSFLDLDWRDLRLVERIDTGRYGKAYRLSVVPDGLPNVYRDVRVTLTVNGDVDRLEMFYGPPAPF